MTRNLNEIERFFNPEPTTTIQPKQVGFKRLTEDAVLPTKAFPTDSGWDLTASEDIIVEPGETVVVKTGIAVELPAGYEATVRPRSGVTAKTKLRVQLGTIDNGYGGEIGVIVDNVYQANLQLISVKDIYEGTEEAGILSEHSPVYKTLSGGEVDISEYRGNGISYESTVGTYLIRKGDRIAQLVITRLPEVTAVEISELGESDRGGKGFGSSGVSV